MMISRIVPHFVLPRSSRHSHFRDASASLHAHVGAGLKPSRLPASKLAAVSGLSTNYALFRADALSQRSCYSDSRGVRTPLRPHSRARRKYSHPPASKLARARYFRRCNSVMLSTFYPHYVDNLRKLYCRKMQILLDAAVQNTYNIVDVFSTYMTACI